MNLIWPGMVLLAVFGTQDAAAATWSFEGSLGAAYHPGTRVTVEQGGQQRHEFSARYATRPFDTPLYYGLRLSRWEGERAWELSFIHDKLYVRNPPPGIDYISISHGFNLITVNRAVRASAITYRVGAGVVVGHPEARVQGVTYDGPYDLAGVVALASVSRRFYVDDKWFLVGDAAMTAGYAKTRAHGEPELTLTLSHVGLHALFGFGRDF